MTNTVEVFETSATLRPHTSWSTALPTSGCAAVATTTDISVVLQGTGMPFAGVVTIPVAPRERHYGPAGTTVWSPPV